MWPRNVIYLKSLGFLFVCLFLFFKTGFLCVVLAGTHSVEQADLELTEIRLSLFPECWHERHVPPLPSNECEQTLGILF